MKEVSFQKAAWTIFKVTAKRNYAWLCQNWLANFVVHYIGSRLPSLARGGNALEIHEKAH